MLSAVGFEKFRPILPSRGATFANAGRKMVVHTLRDIELCIFGKSIGLLAQPDFVLSEGLSMRGCSILLMWRAVSDVTVEDNKCGATFRFSKDVERMFDPVDVIGIADSQHIPSIRNEPCLNIFG